jgi:hypothetical protein
MPSGLCPVAGESPPGASVSRVRVSTHRPQAQHRARSSEYPNWGPESTKRGVEKAGPDQFRRPRKSKGIARKVFDMKTAPVLLGLLLSVLHQQPIAQAQSVTSKEGAPQSITIAEPGRIPLKKLFKMSDTVALVRILSGDTENYETAIYKATVVQSFRGATDGQTLYFGPFIGQRLGFEAIVFLQKAQTPAVPTTKPEAAYGTVPFYKVFNEGYSSMEVSYQCEFDGKEIKDQCDDGVKVCTDYIVLPKGTETSPPVQEETAFGCRWVRRATFLSLLKDFAEPGFLHMP